MLRYIKKVRDPAEPKKPAFAFLIFQKHLKMELDKKGEASSSSKEVKDMIAERWRSLGNEEKQMFLNQAEERNEKYLKKKEEKEN